MPDEIRTTAETYDTVDVVKRRLADGRAIADIDVRRLVAEVERLKAVIRSMGGSA